MLFISYLNRAKRCIAFTESRSYSIVLINLGENSNVNINNKLKSIAFSIAFFMAFSSIAGIYCGGDTADSVYNPNKTINFLGYCQALPLKTNIILQPKQASPAGCLGYNFLNSF